MNIKINHQATVTDCRPETLQEIRRRLIFPNPEYADRKKRGFPIWNIDPEIFCFSSIPGGLVFPRGFTGAACRIAKAHGERLHLDDRRRVLQEVEFRFNGRLKSFQEKAVNDVLPKPFATLAGATGSGKTVMGLKTIVERKQPTLVVVHTKELQDQWVDKTVAFLDIPREEVGVIGGCGKMRIGAKITVALIQSLSKWSKMSIRLSATWLSMNATISRVKPLLIPFHGLIASIN